MKKIITTFLLLVLFQNTGFAIDSPAKVPIRKIVTATKRIYIPTYPGAYNPSIVKFKDGYLMTFRYLPNRHAMHSLSFIGVALLNDSFELIGNTQLLDTRAYFTNTPSQSEDARILEWNGRYYLVFNDNMDVMAPGLSDRRDMYLVELYCENNHFHLSEPIKLVHETKYNSVLWQKNWTPFVYNSELLLTYNISPHEIIKPDLATGICSPLCETKPSIRWNYGTMRGSSIPQLVDGDYLSFFHSGIVTSSASSEGRELWHYFMGAYLFSSEPPFYIKKISPSPIIAPEFYTYSSYSKRVIYPGGYVVDGSTLYLAYGKDDSEIWIATIDLNELKKSMVEVN